MQHTATTSDLPSTRRGDAADPSMTGCGGVGDPTAGDGSSGADENVEAPNRGSGLMLLATAVPVAVSGVLATIGSLPVLAAHVGARRTRPLSVA